MWHYGQHACTGARRPAVIRKDTRLERDRGLCWGDDFNTQKLTNGQLWFSLGKLIWLLYSIQHSFVAFLILTPSISDKSLFSHLTDYKLDIYIGVLRPETDSQSILKVY